jgi:hypothetical protein
VELRRRAGRVLAVVGGLIVGIAALRAYWLAGIGVVVALTFAGTLRKPATLVRGVVGLAAAVSVAVGWLMTFGRDFYEASVAGRLTSFVGGGAAAAADPSLTYRTIEFGTVSAAVGKHWLLGNGFGSTHRGVLVWNPAQADLQASLASYVHNSFLWAYLKAGVAGVAAVAIYSLGLVVTAWRRYRSGHSELTRSAGLGLAVAGVGLAFASMFNAHIGSARYGLVVACVWGVLTAYGAVRTDDHDA